MWDPKTGEPARHLAARDCAMLATPITGLPPSSMGGLTALAMLPKSAQDHAVELRDRGFTVIPDAGIDSIAVKRSAAQCAAKLKIIHDNIHKGLGLDPINQPYFFRDVCYRHFKRWDMQCDADTEIEQLCEQAADCAANIISELHHLPINDNDRGVHTLSRCITQPLFPSEPIALIQTGSIISLPGADAQRFHVDGSRAHFRMSSLLPQHRLFNVFIPLVDITENSTGTQFWPGSHLRRSRKRRYPEVISRSQKVAQDEQAMSEMVAPACPAGGIILFDYRIIHRGLPNAGPTARPLAYAVMATGRAWDKANFPGPTLDMAIEQMAQQDDPVQARSAAKQATPTWKELYETHPRWTRDSCYTW